MVETQSTQAQSEQPHENVLNVRAMTKTATGELLSYRLYEVNHTTTYVYTEPVEHSTHFFRLQPTDDPIQEVVYSKLMISSPGERIQYEDVFGNQALHVIINKPYTTLTVDAKSKVKIFATPPDDHSLSRRQASIPMVWMPWQRQMMMPYLLPQELPESQLTELTDYAMSFVERNDYHLVKTIEDMNTSIYHDYNYVPGTTSLNTTPFEVYSTRQGVCQDFANLLICLARLLSIPARYRMGYIYTGANYTNKIQSDASHAWAELYLPYIGWRGFDPTNGCTVAQDHIRVACGRNYLDATPTAGTIYKGGGTETLTVDVKMHEIYE
jgi:transglutaminase-like putative cysteine protease